MRLTLGFLCLSTLVYFGCDDTSTANKPVGPAPKATSTSAPSNSSAKTSEVVSAAPVAKFSYSPQKGDTTTKYRFDASNSEGNITNFRWDFGDGKTGGGEAIQHKYKKKGRYKVKLTVTDGQNNDTNIKSIRVREDDGGDDDGGGGDGVKCVYSDPPRDPWFFKVISHNPANKTIIAEFEQPATCDDVFYLCGDVRIGGIGGEREFWIGTICEMWSLGNNRFRIHLVDGRYWVDTGETGTYVWPQYDCNPSVACDDFGY